MEELVDSRGRPRVVITGMGAITSIGNSVDESWQSALAGISGITEITQFDAGEMPSRVAGEIKGFNPHDYINFKEARRMSRASQLAVAVATMAVDDAGLPLESPDPERTGVLVGTGVGGFEKADEGLIKYREQGLARVNPFAITSSLVNMPSHHVSLLTNAKGPISTVVAACATGTQAIGEGAEFLRRGAADTIIAGGVEGLIHEAAFAGFVAMRALPTNYNDAPEKASRPFEKDRDGFVISEGAGIVVLETLEHAIKRGARILAEFLGHASSSDAFHVAAPDPSGAGAVRAMKWSLQDAGIDPEDVDYINAHGPGTPVGDPIETLAIKTLFGENAYNIPVSSTKSVTGHAMGAAGAIEAIFCVKALQDGILPPTVNYDTPDPECDLDYVPNTARKANIKIALSNSFGLGGQNACVVFRKYEGQEDQ
jgi:3-oxoacyl-[acyl-carrier-protein] synthase II